MRPWLPVTIAGLVSTPLAAADLSVSIDIPRINVSEYHRPYLAVWLETPDQKVVANLAVWYEMKKANAEGTKWLKDIRQWWRKTGRDLEMPVDAVSGATRPVGQHTLTFSSGKAPLGTLAPGSYQLVVEAAREVGGRELVRIPFQWPAAKTWSAKVQGENELGALTLTVQP